MNTALQVRMAGIFTILKILSIQSVYFDSIISINSSSSSRWENNRGIDSSRT